ncbi:hypothetical protein M0812_10740 [Anaeramoeba flamelloides]|uniref:HTH CENPB-type domain-containing protein n=1 Tax=Anaeramoeba flamelloides TaxID=1746091 RepID=A0AAV7ZY92_9EUKA|nr:hypothetical protein M0812_10740 [Anaeramoeba flamelloides]
MEKDKEISIAFEVSDEEDPITQDFQPLNSCSNSDSESSDTETFVEDHVPQNEKQNIDRVDQNASAEEVTSDDHYILYTGPEEDDGLGENDQIVSVEEEMSQDPQNNFFGEEEIENLLQSRLFQIFDRATIVTNKEIREKNLVIENFSRYPKLMLIENTIEMFASAICVCERKNIKPFNENFVRSMFKIQRGKIYRAKKAIKSGREVGKSGRPCLLNRAEEEFIVERLKILALIGWAPTLDETVDIANEIIDSWLQIDYNVQRPSITSTMWVKEFAKRNNLRITKSSPIEYQRIIVSEDLIRRFFYTLKELFMEKDYDSNLVFNMVETSLKLDKNSKHSVVTLATKKGV